MRFNKKNTLLRTGTVVMFWLLTANTTAQESQKNTAPAMPAPKVGVIIATPQDITIYENLPARLEASREAVIRARVNGIVEKRLFTEGSYVKAGQILYRIDDAMYQAGLQSAKAQLAQAQANKKLAQLTAKRYAPLVREKAISRQQYDQATAQVDVAQANIAAANAALRQAQINLDYTKISAPISGYIGRSLVTEGALVSAAGATPMATIQQLDPMYINIAQSAGDLMRLKRTIQSGESSGVANSVNITLEDGTKYPYSGHLLFADRSVNQSTGELLVRAEVANPNRDLLPGLYVRAEVPQEQYKNIFLIPQRAVSRGATDTVKVVAKDGTFSVRPVKVLRDYDNRWIVNAGIKPGEMIMVDTLSLLMQGAKRVSPVILGADGKPLPQQETENATVPSMQ